MKFKEMASNPITFGRVIGNITSRNSKNCVKLNSLRNLRIKTSKKIPKKVRWAIRKRLT